MNQAPLRSALWGAVVHVSCHLFLWLLFVAVLVFYVPSRQRIFVDFKFKVPDMTIQILDLSNWMTEYWFFLMPFLILILLIVDAPIYFLCRVRLRSRALSRLWSAFMILVPLAGLGITFLALLLPYLKVLEGLSK